MDPEHQFSSSKLEKLPIIDAQCCVNITKSDQSSENEEDLYKRRSSAKCCTFIYLIEFLFATLILSFSGFMIYLAATSGYFEQLSQPDETYPRVRSISIEPLLESHQETKEESLQNLYQYVYRDKLHERTRQQRSATLQIDRNRFKRGSDTTPCQQNMKHCESLINSMWRIVNIVNSSLPTLETYLKNTATDANEKKSKLFELVECLQCKNDSIAFIDESGPENLAVNDHRLNYQHSDQAQIKNHIDIVTNLLNNNDRETGRYNSSTTLNFTGQTTLNMNDGKKDSVRTSTTSVFEEQQKIDFRVTTQESETRLSSAKTMEYESMPTEVAMIDATTSGSTKAEGTNVPMDGIDDTKQSVVTVNVTTKDNVTEIANTTVHPSVHPSNQGHGETRQSEREATKNNSKSEFRERQGRIVSKISLDSAPGTMPTAETIKSSQQLQLVPSMSWMPYQVCFYGPPPNGQMKQTAPGQITYPASSPGAPYPVSMPQTRPGFQNANPSPNYLMVQANSVQFSPGQSFQNSNTQPGNQRMGPIGPGMQNFPMFPGHQMNPSAGANSAGSSSYYCTYIPAPTFQFPAIPGVSEYQRSSNDESTKNEMESAINALRAVNENETSDQRILLPQYMEACPPNTIRCGDGQRCILRSQRCNGEVDCNDASDETTCTCRDRISQERLCDGYFDCPHGEDELGCLGCSKTSFSCDDWQRRYTIENCVPLSQRCDGVKQCANGKDEMDCNILTPSHIEGKNVFTIGYSEGYLHKNFKGQWYPVCTTDDSWVEEACISEIGQELASKPETKIHSVPDTAYQGPYLANVEGQMKLVPSCMNTAIFVRCPQFRCGTRIISRADSLRPHAVEREAQDSLRPHDEALPRLFRDKQGQRLDENDTDVSNQDEMVGSQLRIVGGRSSQPKAWPFLVAIYRDGHFYCGGVILNELWVLTAAHCLDGYVGHYYEIQAGMLRQFSFSPMAQFRKARYTVTHPQYTNEDMGNDIGMIMLDSPLHFNRWVRPVCLPGQNILGPMWRKKPEPGSYCVAIGWGATREHGPDLYKNRLSRKQSLNFLADHMREVTLPILDRCKYEIDQNEATICAGYPQGGRDACQGDSGGPLMCKDPYSESQWYVAGIVSHGEGCARPDEPGIYTRVSSFLNWIQETSNNQGIPPMRRTPLETCPGFSCEGGLGKCLPAEARCNQIVDCLDGEDELNCRSRYPLYRQAENPDSEADATIILENSTIPDAAASTDATLIYPTTDESLLEDEMNNEIEFDDAAKITTTYSPNYTESASSLPPTVFPTVFTCTRLLQSILMEKRCDRMLDCEDGTDEINCTCKDYLMHTKSDAICDGYVDCDDLTDEQNCTNCAEEEFFCKRSKTCIPMSKRCNAKLDCEFNEDELDCFTLTNGHHVHLDADNQPSLNIYGVLTRFSDGKWQPVCHHPRMHNSESTAITIGKNMCKYFGFANLQSSQSVIVKNSELKVIPWSKTKSRREENSTAASLNEEDERCPGLHIHCTPVLNGNVYTYYRDHVKVWPWLAAISVDGNLRCTALLLNQDWLLASAKCLRNVSLDKKYTVADMGYALTLRHIQGPHQQTSMIDEVHFVNNSVAALLHLKDGFTFGRQVRPLFLDRKIYLPGVKDTCEAVGTNEVDMRSVVVRPILQNCPSCTRCFVNVSEDCLGSETSEWSGTIFCHGKTGWYPAAVFQDNKGLCSFTSARTMTSIDYINPYLTEVADSQRKLTIFDQSTCDGFRCSSGQCVPKNRMCDGIPDCSDQGDEDPGYCKQFKENCETREDGCICTKMELRCRNGNCVDKSAFCDEVNDCTDGSDEPAICNCAEYLKLTSPELLCDGVRNCLDKSDESPEMCPCSDNSFKCSTANGNDTCIPQDFICDNDKDCYNGEDEAICKMLKPLSSDSGTSGEVITRSYGVWHSECLPSPLTSEDDASKLCKSMGYTTGSVSNDSEIIEDPVLPKSDDFYIVKLNKLTWMTLRGNRPLTTLEKSNKTCHRAFIDCI